MRDGGAGIAQIGGNRHDLRRVDDFPGCLLAADQFERHDAAAVDLLPHRQGVLRM